MSGMTGIYKARVLSHKRHLAANQTANPALRRKTKLDTEKQFKIQNSRKSIYDYKFPKVRVKIIYF